MKQIITSSEQLSSITGNKVIGSPVIRNSKIVFSGEGNTLYCEEGVILQSSSITFDGNNALVILGKSRHSYIIKLSANNNCSIVIGREVYFNSCLYAIASEECTIIVGDDCALSFGIWIRTADPHLVYDIESKKRINYSKNIIIGDHVWIGQGAILLKGTVIGSGSIIGAMGVVAGKDIPSNESWAGNPSRCIGKGIFWQGSCVHTWTSEQTARYAHLDTNDFIFCEDKDTITNSCIPSCTLSSEERLAHYLSIGYENWRHNRFFVGSDK